MIPESYRNLIDLLVMRTKNDEVQWKSTGENAFAVFFDSFSLVLRQDEGDYNNPETMWVQLFDPNGDLIDSVEETEGTDFQLLKTLHGNARRKALRIDEALNKLVARLQSEGAVGDDPPVYKSKPTKRGGAAPERPLSEPDDDLPF